MVLIIDGYNLIKQVFHKIKGRLEDQRNRLIRELGFYKKRKVTSINDIILVFDGGFSNHADRQIHSGVIVIFSGTKNSADDWIINFSKRHKNEEMLLITRDNKLKSSCKKFGVDSVDVYDFYDIVQNTILEDVEKKIKLKKIGQGQILKHDAYIYNQQLEGFKYNDLEAFDILMSQADLGGLKNDNNKERSSKYKEKMSKNDKRVYNKIKKL